MLRFTSNLKPEFSEELEQLMFFNPGQETALAAIMDSLEKFGAPSVYVDGGCLRVKVEKLDGVQTLFALDDERLVGVLVYSRISIELLVVIHIAVGLDYSSQGKFAHKMLVMRMIELLRSNSRRIKGIETIRVMFSDNQIRDFSV